MTIASEVFNYLGQFFERHLSLLLTTLASIVLLVQAWKNRSRLRIHKVNYRPEEIRIVVENLGSAPNSIKQIKIKGVKINVRKNRTESLKITSDTLLPPCKVTVITAIPKDLIDLWFIKVTIITNKSRSKKIRMRHCGSLEKNKLKFFQYHLERFLFNYFPKLYEKYFYQ